MPQTFGANTPAEIQTTQTDTGQKPKSGKTPKTNTERHALLKSRLKVAKAWAKKPHDSWKRWIAEYNIEDVGDTDEIRDKVRIGYVFRKTESEIPAIFDDQPDLFIKGRQGDVKSIVPLIEGAYDFLWDIQNLEELIEDVGVYFELIGMGFIKSPYVTKTKPVTQPAVDEAGQPVVDPATGQPAMQTYEVPIVDNPVAAVPNPFKLYFSPETKFGPTLDHEHCPYYFEEMTVTPDEVEAKYGVTVTADETLKLDDTDADAELSKETLVSDDLKRVTLYEYYGSLPKEMAPKGSEWAYDKDYHLLLTNTEEVLVEECPYESKPLFMVGNYGLANTFWKFGDAKHLIPLVQELEVYRSQILKHTRKMANPKPLIPTLANVDEAAFLDPRVGRPVKYEGGQAPSYLSPANLGKEVETGIQQARTDLEKESGTFDLASGGAQSTVRTPRGIQVFAEASDKNIRRKRKKIARFIRHLIVFQLKQIGTNWTPEDAKTLAVTGADGSSESIQVTAEVLEVLSGVNILYQLDIEIESLSVNKVQIRQDALSLWDLAKESPDIFNLTELAKWMLQSGFSMKDGDRFILTEEQKAEMAASKAEAPKVSVSVRADATTPPGAAILEQSGVVAEGTAVQAVIDNQVQEAVAGETQVAQNAQSGAIQSAHRQEEQAAQVAFKPPVPGGAPSA